MRFSLTPRQLVFLFYIITLLFSCVLGVRSSDNKPKTCCPTTSPGRVSSGRVAKCAYTEKSGRCLEAYVFVLNNGTRHCSSVNAKGINATLAMLKRMGCHVWAGPRADIYKQEDNEVPAVHAAYCSNMK